LHPVPFAPNENSDRTWLPLPQIVFKPLTRLGREIKTTAFTYKGLKKNRPDALLTVQGKQPEEKYAVGR
jgi:hypothetical protein